MTLISENLEKVLDGLSAAEFSRRASVRNPKWGEGHTSLIRNDKMQPSQEFVEYVHEVYGVWLLEGTGMVIELLRQDAEHPKAYAKRIGDGPSVAEEEPLKDKLTEELEKWIAHENAKHEKESQMTESEPIAVTLESKTEPVTVRISDGICTVTIGAFSMSMSEGEFTIGNADDTATVARKGAVVRHRGLAGKMRDYLADNADRSVRDTELAENFGADLKAVRNAGSYLLHQEKVDRSIKTDGHWFQLLPQSS